jgi:transposase
LRGPLSVRVMWDRSCSGSSLQGENGSRRPMSMTSASLLARAHDGDVPDPDPAARPKRRSFSAEYKARLLDEYDALPAGDVQRGALLRREGLYSSHIAEWRKARDAAVRSGLEPKTRGAKRTPEQFELERLRKRTARLEAGLERTKLALEITGKAHALLEMLSEGADTETRAKP